MPIDINLLRVEKGGDPEVVHLSEKRRCRSGSFVNKTIAADTAWRKQIFELEMLRKQLNSTSAEIALRKKQNKNDECTELVEKCEELNRAIAEMEIDTKMATDTLNKFLNKIGNIVHPSVITSDNEDNNLVLRTWGTLRSSEQYDGSPGKLRHHEIASKLDIVEFKKGVEVAGHRAYYLKGAGVMLNQALISYGLSFLRKHGYTEIQPPYFMKYEVMEETAELQDFSETLYKIPVDVTPQKNDLLLIATSEQPISALHRGESINPKELPLKYAGISSCFRKEAGSHGKDMWGIFRTHQFEKVEQFIITAPEDSDAAHNDMISVAEQFYQSLNLPYRVVSIVGGALNNAASIKYDLEAWFPGYGAYRELVSCSNCTDYQARALCVRVQRHKQGSKEKNFVHMLNGTLVATERTMCCILENYQTGDGVEIPPALHPYMDGIHFLKYKN